MGVTCKDPSVSKINYTKFGILRHYKNFLDDVSYEWVMNIVMDDGRVHPLAKTLPSLVNNLWWNSIMRNGNLDEKTLGEW